MILGFWTAESCGAATKRRGVVARNSPRVSASQFVAPILRYMPSKGEPSAVEIPEFGKRWGRRGTGWRRQTEMYCMFGLQAIDKTYRAVGKRLRLRRGKHWAIIFCSHVATSATNSRKRKFLRDRRSENEQKGPFDKENSQGGRGYSNNDS